MLCFLCSSVLSLLYSIPPRSTLLLHHRHPRADAPPMDDEFFVTKVYTTACTAVLLWDTVLTTRREYRALWRRESGAHIGLKEVMYCFSRWVNRPVSADRQTVNRVLSCSLHPTVRQIRRTGHHGRHHGPHLQGDGRRHMQERPPPCPLLHDSLPG